MITKLSNKEGLNGNMPPENTDPNNEPEPYPTWQEGNIHAIREQFSSEIINALANSINIPIQQIKFIEGAEIIDDEGNLIFILETINNQKRYIIIANLKNNQLINYKTFQSTQFTSFEF